MEINDANKPLSTGGGGEMSFSRPCLRFINDSFLRNGTCYPYAYTYTRVYHTSLSADSRKYRMARIILETLEDESEITSGSGDACHRKAVLYARFS